MQEKTTVIGLADHKKFMALAVPLTIATLTTPLLGVVDTAIMGRLPQAAYIGGVSIAVLIFNTLYWILGFLRVSTSGFSAQAVGTGDKQAITLALLRPMVIAVSLGLLIVALQWPIKQIAFALLSPSGTVGAIAAAYYDIRIWSAPFTLGNYVIAGWLMGRAKVKLSLALQIFMNVLNMLLAVLFVAGLGMTAEGVAAATLIAEIAAAIVSAVILLRTGAVDVHNLSLKTVIDPAAFIQMMKVNRDLFIRTACLLTVYNCLAAYGLRYGDTILAGNAVLMQLHFVMAYFLSGFANAGTVLVGQAIGEKNKALYVKTVRLTAFWGGITALLLTAIVGLFQRPLIELFTTIVEVQQVALQYMFWIALFPPAAFWGLQLYGIFVGATLAAPIRNSLLYSLATYFVCLWLAVPGMGNHGIWLAFTVFSLGRSVFLWIYLPGLNRRMGKMTA
ncbi:MATE family efflux transporter|uniref:Probable multidrug resistance protein NorM n=1 Tax=Dendrosporobacter quercicolus TaxID=146817 RepID=A0A1G9QUY9_9FIRM|nr:MATE family efflux transporter [Dendrosporobacter quercicolus]NSL48374.1 MATE family efflux transporter [Dendrosporobacter quercicolus DSM 1736]SDM14832.1 multidrug resistance protein, MATE family [Dendrosporobacter quercicolus]